VVSSGGTGTHHLHRRRPGVTEVQAGSYALMDSHYGAHGHPFVQACHVLGTVISISGRRAVADVGLKAMGMDHGNPTTPAGTVWFLSDEHVTFSPRQPHDPHQSHESHAPHESVALGDRVPFVPAHIDPTMAMHEVAWLVQGDEVVDRWPIDLRGW
jgi:D-threonine aldolase